MSRRNKRVLQRAQRVPSGGVVLPAAVVQAAIAKYAGTSAFSPGKPLEPQPSANPGGIPRGYSFPIAINTSGIDRSQGLPDIPSFQQLRNLARLYSGIGLCERVWFDMVPKLKLKISLRQELVKAGDSEDDYQKEIAAYQQFFEKPDRQHDLHSWLRIALREQTQIDELYIYKRRTRGGQLYSLEIVDGATIKPLLDDWGRVPQPPEKAYQQFPWGIPGEQYPTNDLIHYSESPAADNPYGFSRVERIIMEVNQALRKKRLDLARYTEGNIPSGIMEVPEASNWTPDQIEAYEQMWNSLIAGNVQQQVRIKFTQPGMRYQAFDQTSTTRPVTEFDQFLLNITTAAYGVSMADLSFTGDIHKSSDDGQQNMLYRRTLGPIVAMYAGILTGIIRDDFGDDRFMVEFGGFEESEDIGMLSTAYGNMIDHAMISPAQAAAILKLPQIPETGPFRMAGNTPIFLSDMEEGSEARKAQQAAQMAGYELAKQAPQQQQNAPNPGGDTDKQKGNTDNATDDEENTGGDARRASIAELKRWRTCALRDVKSGRGPRTFESFILPVAERARIQNEMERGASTDAIKAVFQEAFDRLENSTFLAEAVVSGGNLTSSRIDWRTASLKPLARS